MSVKVVLMPNRPGNKVGRPHKRGELIDVQHPVKLPESIMAQLRQAKEDTGVPIAAQIRKAVENALSGRYVDIANIGVDDPRLKFLTKATAGPWRESLDHAEHFTLSEDVAQELDVNPITDVVVRVDGESMESAGIIDGSLLVMRPLTDRQVPRKNEIALVEIVTEDGDYESTIKFWVSGDPVKLADGQGKDYPLPKKYRSARAVAVARGVIGRL